MSSVPSSTFAATGLFPRSPAAADNNTTASSFSSSTDSDNSTSIWLYNPSFTLAVVFAVLYVAPMVAQYYLTCFRYRFRQKFFLLVAVAAHLEVAGYIVRAVSTKNLASIPPYATSASLIVIAPLFVCAGLYMLLSRLALAILPVGREQAPILGIPPRLLARIFVSSDIASLFTQCAGSSIASSGNWTGTTLHIGEDLLIAGLAMQVATFSFFMVLTYMFHRRVTLVSGIELQERNEWRQILLGMYVSGVLVLIRSIYRLVEFALGFHGYPFTHEWIFYVFESAPMLVALSVLCVFHPGKYLPSLEASKSGSRDVENSKSGEIK